IPGALQIAALCALLAGCGGGDDAEPRPAATATPATAAAAAEAPTFSAAISGDIDRAVAGNALSGARYGRYHINLASERGDDGSSVVIAFGRSDTSMPASGTYSLGGDGDFPDGSLEIYGNPQREFAITGGELEITGAAGGVITGTFSFTARESPEEY